MPFLDQIFGCISKGDLNRLISLLNKNTSMVNAQNEDGISLLQYSVLQEQVDILIYLTNIGECQLAQNDMHYEHTALHTACMHNSMKMAQVLLQKMKPSEVSMQDKFGWTALHHASRNGNVNLCKLLLRHHIRVDTRNELGKTAIHYATQYGYLEIVKLLYEFVSSSVTPSATERFSLPVMTLLHLAALNDHAPVVEWLQMKLYPPNIKCRRALHQNGDITSEELPEDTAAKRGHISLKTSLQTYHSQYGMWLQDIVGNCSPLEYVKLCLCGPTDSGKTSLKDSLEKNNLQLILGLGHESNEDQEHGKKRHTYGIDISTLHLGSKESFQLWDFCGDMEAYITHCYFLTTEHSAYVLVLDLSKPIETFRMELEFWLRHIKSHNLGAKTVYRSNRRQPDVVSFPKKDEVPPPPRSKARPRASTFSSQPQKFRERFGSSSTLKPSWISRSAPQTRSRSTNFTSSNLPSPPSERPSEVENLPSIFPVPVIVVGSHFDCLPDKNKRETVRLIDDIVLDISQKYRNSINVLPQLFRISGGEKISSSEIRYLKEQLSNVRSTLLANSLLFPRVFDKVAKKVEALRLECPDRKVVEFDEFCKIIQSQINGLLSQTQISYVLKILHNAGVVVYLDALSHWVFLDPAWLCNSTLGYLLSPKTHPKHLSFNEGKISKEEIATFLPSMSDHSEIVFKILHNLELYCCIRTGDSSEVFYFPSMARHCNDSFMSLWVTEKEKFIKYVGRKWTTCEECDYFPAGFVPFLQAQMVFLQNNKNLALFESGFILDSTTYQCMVKVDRESNNSIEFIGRISSVDYAGKCLLSLDRIQNLVAKLSRTMCPAIFFQHSILSSSDLQDHSPSPQVYQISAVIAADKGGPPLINIRKQSTELPCDLLFFGDSQLMLKGSGLSAKVAYLDDLLFEKMGDLLTEDGIQPGWKKLAEHINLSEYSQFLEGESQPTKKLIMKWGEKPRWTVDSLLYALQDIKRIDVYDYVKAKTDPKYEIKS